MQRKFLFVFQTCIRFHRNFFVTTNILSKHFSCGHSYFKFINLNSHQHMESLTTPNILIYTGEDENNGNRVIYQNIVKNISACLHPDCYTIYLLTPLQVIKDPWDGNLACLIISCETLTEEISESFRKYLKNGGRIFNFGCKFNFPGMCYKEYDKSCLTPVQYNELETWLYSCKFGIASIQCRDVIATDTEGNARIIKMHFGKGVIMVSDVHLEIDESILVSDEQILDVLKDYNNSRIDILMSILCDHFGLLCAKLKQTFDLSPCFLVMKENIDKSILPKSPPQLSYKQVNLTYFDYSKVSSMPLATENELQVMYNCPEKEFSSKFNKNLYFSFLKTQTFGQILFFIDVVGTTMSIIQNLSDIEGVVVAANIQVHGKGRGRNHWITPKGAVAFSTHFSLSLQSPLGHKLSIIQYFLAVSFVKAIREIPGYEKLNILIKWPNDIYYDKTKIGGVLANSTIQGNRVHVYTGSGLNVDNSKPSLCVNDIIRQYNEKTNSNLKTFSCEELIARSLNELELLIKNYQENNVEYFLTSYYKYWMHLNKKVSLTCCKGNATITGIDPFGFLIVETKDEKRLLLQPDGNSFDIIKNLIIVKEI